MNLLYFWKWKCFEDIRFLWRTSNTILLFSFRLVAFCKNSFQTQCQRSAARFHIHWSVDKTHGDQLTEFQRISWRSAQTLKRVQMTIHQPLEGYVQLGDVGGVQIKRQLGCIVSIKYSYLYDKLFLRRLPLFDFFAYCEGGNSTPVSNIYYKNNFDCWGNSCCSASCQVINRIQIFLIRVYNTVTRMPILDLTAYYQLGMDLAKTVSISVFSNFQQFARLKKKFSSGSTVHPKSISARLIAITWWLFGFMILTSYAANLATMLTEDTSQIPIRYIDDLMNQFKINYARWRIRPVRRFSSGWHNRSNDLRGEQTGNNNQICWLFEDPINVSEPIKNYHSCMQYNRSCAWSFSIKFMRSRKMSIINCKSVMNFHSNHDDQSCLHYSENILDLLKIKPAFWTDLN